MGKDKHYFAFSNRVSIIAELFRLPIMSMDELKADIVDTAFKFSSLRFEMKSANAICRRHKFPSYHLETD